jgi:hypothetical protein
MSRDIFKLGPNSTTEHLRCPRCQGPVRVGVTVSDDLTPTAVLTCPSLGLACSGKKLADVALVPSLRFMQLDLNVREIVRRFQLALATIVRLREGDAADYAERLGAAIHVAQTAMAGIVPVPGQGSIGAPTDSDAAVGTAHEVLRGDHRRPMVPGTIYPRSCADCGVKVLAPKAQPGDPPLRCPNCAARPAETPAEPEPSRPCKGQCGTRVPLRLDSSPKGPLCPKCRAELERMAGEQPTPSDDGLVDEHPMAAVPLAVPPGSEERACFMCSRPVVMPIGSDETAVCGDCAKNQAQKADASSEEKAALPRVGDPVPAEKASGVALGGEVPMWRAYGYGTEAEYYEKEWGGADCPACGATLDATGRRHADPAAEERCRSDSFPRNG